MYHKLCLLFRPIASAITARKANKAPRVCKASTVHPAKGQWGGKARSVRKVATARKALRECSAVKATAGNRAHSVSKATLV